MKALLISISVFLVIGCGADVLREADTEVQTNNPINPNTVASDTGSSDTSLPPVETGITDTGLPVDTYPVDTGLPVDTGVPVDTSPVDTGLPVDTGSATTEIDTGTGTDLIPCEYTCLVTGQCTSSVGTPHRDRACPAGSIQVCCELLPDTTTIDNRPDCTFTCVNTGTCPASGIGSAGIPHREMSCGSESQVCCDDHSQDPTLPTCIYTCDMGLACGPSYEYVPDMVCPTQDGAVFTCCKALFDTDNPVDTGTGEPVDTGTGDPVDTGTGDPIDTGAPYCSYTCLSNSISCTTAGGIEYLDEICITPNTKCCDLTDTASSCALGSQGISEHFDVGVLPEGWEISRGGNIRVTDLNSKSPLNGYYLKIEKDHYVGDVYAISPSYDTTGCSNVTVYFDVRYLAYMTGQYPGIFIEWDGNGTWYNISDATLFDHGINTEFSASYKAPMTFRGTLMRIKIIGYSEYINIDNFHVFPVR